MKKIIAVASGKGGTGKSTTAVNLALALQATGATVGLLDADIYGPSQPQMLGIDDKPRVNANKKFEPVMRYGLQTNSIGYLIKDEQAMIWRGPMVSSALMQLLNDTAWQDLDYLVIDLPPGTGDIQLTLAKKVPVNGAIIVTTPQPVAVIDAARAIAMFQKVKLPILGIVENMSYHICPHCEHKSNIFGAHGGEELAKQYELECLVKIPLDAHIRVQSDLGKPIVMSEPDGKIAKLYLDLAQKVIDKLAAQPVDYRSRFPRIVVESTQDKSI